MVDGRDGPGIVKEKGQEPSLQEKVAQLNDKVESLTLDRGASLSQDQFDKHNQSYLDDQTQRRDMRKTVSSIAKYVIFFMMALIVADLAFTACGMQEQVDGSVRIALFVSPIISITTITIFLLVGAFRGFKEKDMKNLPVSTIVNEAGRVFSGR